MTTGQEAELTLRAAGYRCFGISLAEWLSPDGDVVSTEQALAELAEVERERVYGTKNWKRTTAKEATR